MPNLFHLFKPPLCPTQILKYHVVPGAPITTAQMGDAQKLPTLLAADLAAAASASATPTWHKQGASEDGVLTLDVKKVQGKGRGWLLVGEPTKGWWHLLAAVRHWPQLRRALLSPCQQQVPLPAYQPAAASHTLPPPPSHPRPQVIDLMTHQVIKNITVVGSLSAAGIVTPDVQAGCPAVVHVVDGVLLPAIPPLVEDGDMWAALMKIWGQ